MRDLIFVMGKLYVPDITGLRADDYQIAGMIEQITTTIHLYFLKNYVETPREPVHSISRPNP